MPGRMVRVSPKRARPGRRSGWVISIAPASTGPVGTDRDPVFTKPSPLAIVSAVMAFPTRAGLSGRVLPLAPGMTTRRRATG